MTLHRIVSAFLLTVSAMTLGSSVLLAQHGNQSGHPEGTPESGSAAKPAEMKLPPLSEDKSVAQTVTVHGKTLHYTATVGTIKLTAPDGHATGEVVFTAYILDGDHVNRPVLFAFNGGPGAASGYLNFGAVGPKHVTFGNAGDSPSDPPSLTDNPGTWLDFTDEVFLDPIGTGYSRSLVNEAETKKLFYGPTQDVEYLSTVIYKWLVKNERMPSKKYILGESYGGFRGPRIAHYLQTESGVGVNGLFLVSPYLNPSFGDGNFSPIPWMITLPSITAAHLENEGKLTPEAMKDVIAYDEGEYASTLIKGSSDPSATNAMIQRVTEMTGLSPEFVKRSGGRLDTRAFLREIHRDQGTVGSVYDSNVTDPDPYPYSSYQQSGDPILESGKATITEAMVNFVTVTVGWKSEAQYELLSGEVNQQWDRQNRELERGSVPDLREALAADPKFQVAIFHGWNDLSCAFMGSILTQNQLPPTLAKQLTIREFPGGHMFYTRPANSAGLHDMAEQVVAKH
jgi:carboxypeptidase C (cathepsin A)